MAGFTRDDQPMVAPCWGTGHSDAGVIGTCDGCGSAVARREDGKIFNVARLGPYDARKIVCWAGTHRCDPQARAEHEARLAARVAAGEIVKGCTVIVFKGRKVPVGTTGVVTWLGTDSYGKTRIGLRRDDGTTVFVAGDHCRPC